MNFNIGQVADFLLPFSNKITLEISKGLPLLRAWVSNSGLITQSIFYVVQTGNDRYSAIDGCNDVCGERFFLSHIESKPFILEKEFIRYKYGYIGKEENWYDHMVTSVDFPTLVWHLINRLSYYEVIRYKTANGIVTFDQMDFTSTRIRRAVEKAFKEEGRYNNNLHDLIDIVVGEQHQFQMKGLKNSEVQCVIRKLKGFGIKVSLSGDAITEIHFERK